VADIIVAVDEPVDVTRCGGKANCNSNSRCLTHDLWTDLSRQVYDFLNNRSLADVLKRHQEQMEKDGVRQVVMHGRSLEDLTEPSCTAAPSAAERS
jgi:Rrf2 family iron-sulfur cluster assembly transcriptional regulator